MKKTVLLFLLGSAALAQAQLTPYVRADGGGAKIFGIDYNDGTTSGRVKTDVGYVAEGAVGLKINNSVLRTEIAYAYQKCKLGEIRVHANGVDDISGLDLYAEISTIMWNWYLDFGDRTEAETGTVFVPYVVGGAGRADIDIEGDSDTVFAYQLGGGVALHFTKNIALDVNYKYLRTADTRLGDNELDSQVVEAGLICYLF